MMKSQNNGDATRYTRPIILFDQVPAEFDLHAASWLSWPESGEHSAASHGDYSGRAALARSVAGFERMICGAGPRPSQPGLAFLLDVAGEVRIVNWRRSAWGGLICRTVSKGPITEARLLDFEEIEAANGPCGRDLFGHFTVRCDGEGTFWVAASRAPGATGRAGRGECAAQLERFCGARQIIWMPDGMSDDLLAPVGPGVVALAWVDDATDPRRDIAREALDWLRRARDAQGRELRVVIVPSPARAAATYLGFLPVSGGVIVPTFDDPLDADAIATMRELFPERRVVALAAARGRPAYAETRIRLRAPANPHSQPAWLP